MKILQLRSHFEDSGPGTQSLTIAKELRRRGHEVQFACAGGMLVPTIKAEGFQVNDLPALTLHGRNPLSTFKSVLGLRALVRRQEIQVIHAHNAATAYAAFIATRGLAGKTHVVHSCRGIELRESHQWRNWIYKVYPVDIMAVSQFTKNELTRLGANPDRIFLTFNGVDVTKFDPESVDRTTIRQEFHLEGATVVGHVGAFSGAKGQEILVQAVARLKDEFPSLRALMVGVGPDYEPVRKLAADLGVLDRVVFAGFRTDIPIFQAAFDIYTQPSTYGEMFPNAILEAMAMGNPWVGSDVSGLAELTAGGAAGMVSEPGNVEAFTANLKLLLADENLRRRMGERGRQEIFDRFTIARVVDRIERVYANQAK